MDPFVGDLEKASAVNVLTSPFLALPGELRLKTYEQLLYHDH